VGLDVVRDRITSLNGTVDLTSSAGQGTTFNIRLPLTLAIMRSLLVRFRNGVFSIPIDDVREIVSVPPDRVQTIHDRRTINVRGEFIRIASMDELFRWNVPDTSTGVPAANAATTAGHDQLNVVMIRSGDRTLGLCVDELLGSSDVVIKSLSDNFREIPGLSGASVMGTGAVSLMIDVHALIQLA